MNEMATDSWEYAYVNSSAICRKTSTASPKDRFASPKIQVMRAKMTKTKDLLANVGNCETK